MDVVAKLKLVGVLTNAHKFSIVNSIVVAIVVGITLVFAGDISIDDDAKAENCDEDVANMQSAMLNAVNDTEKVSRTNDSDDYENDSVKHINLHVLSPSAIDLSRRYLRVPSI